MRKRKCQGLNDGEPLSITREDSKSGRLAGSLWSAAQDGPLQMGRRIGLLPARIFGD